MGGARGLGGRDLVRKHQASWPEASFLAGLERQALDELVAGRQGIRFPAGKSILIEGELPGDVFLLFDAVVKVTARLGKGTALLAVRVGGDIVGEMAVADGGARSATVTATRGDLAIAVPGDEFLEVVGRYPAAGKLLAAQLSRKLRAANRRRVDFTAYKVPERVARVLLELAEDYGRPELGRPSALTLRIGITQREFATLVGAAESTVHEVLAELEARNILTWHYRAVEIRDMEVLRLAGRDGEPGLAAVSAAHWGCTRLRNCLIPVLLWLLSAGYANWLSSCARVTPSPWHPLEDGWTRVHRCMVSPTLSATAA